MAVRARAKLEIRRMKPDDLEEVMVIERVAFPHPWSTELFRRELEHDWSTILVAVEPLSPLDFSECITGFLIYWLVHDEVHILNVATDTPHRRRGVARALLVECLARGKEHGAVLATLEVRKGNAAALELYTALGFRSVGVRPNYYVDEGEDAVVMLRDM